jgi:hypothetical protein
VIDREGGETGGKGAECPGRPCDVRHRRRRFRKALASSGRMKSGRPGLSLMANFSKLAADPASSSFSQANLHKN